MKRKIVHHWGLVFGEILVIASAVIIGENVLSYIGINLFSLLIALPAIFIGLAMRYYFTPLIKKQDLLK